MKLSNCGLIAGEAGICSAWPRMIGPVNVAWGTSCYLLAFVTRVFDWTRKKGFFQVPRKTKGLKSRMGAWPYLLMYFARIAG